MASRRKTLRDAVTAPAVRPSTDSFLDHFFALAGGPEQVAKMLFDEFQSATPGSLIRARVMETVLRSLKASDARNGQLDDLGAVSDDDLLRLLADREAALLPLLRAREADSAPPPDLPPPAAGV